MVQRDGRADDALDAQRCVHRVCEPRLVACVDPGSSRLDAPSGHNIRELIRRDRAVDRALQILREPFDIKPWKSEAASIRVPTRAGRWQRVRSGPYGEHPACLGVSTDQVDRKPQAQRKLQGGIREGSLHHAPPVAIVITQTGSILRLRRRPWIP